jgi:hypothetical protein
MQKFSLLVLLGTLLSSLHLSAGDTAKTYVPIVFSKEENIQWVEKCMELHPEILWLADADVRKTEEGHASSQGSYSEQLFDHKFIEFDRTLMTLRCLKLILDGSEKAYQEFTADQPKELKLAKESFQTLHLQGQLLLKSQWEGMSELQMAQAMETALVLGDIGKSKKARELFKCYGIGSPDHDDFYGEAMQVLPDHPGLSPSFLILSPQGKRLLAKVANLAHYGHITHLEGGISMFDKLLASGIAFSDPIALSFDLFVHTCDVAGALGHANNRSSLMYTEPVHKSLQATGDSVRTLADPNKTQIDAYNAYLAVRASWLGLNPEQGLDRVLARLGAMLRLFTPEEGTLLRQAMEKLDLGERDRIIIQFDIQKGDQLKRTPTYMPAVLVNLSNNPQLGISKEERLEQAITLGLPFIVRVLEKHKEQLSRQEGCPDIPLNFNKIAGLAKTDPNQLGQEFCIDNEGNVFLEKTK